MRPIFGQASVEAVRVVGEAIHREVFEAGNIACLPALRDMAKARFAVSSGWASEPGFGMWPWKKHPTFTGGSETVRCANTYGWDDDGSGSGYAASYRYPSRFAGGGSGSEKRFNLTDAKRARRTASGSIDATFTTANGSVTNSSRVFAALGASGGITAASNHKGDATLLSIADVPTTMIGTPFLHPSYDGTVTTTAGQAYLTGMTIGGSDHRAITNLGSLAPWGVNAMQGQIIRLRNGADAGVYFISRYDFTNNRLYLRNLDGTPFSATATSAANAISVSISIRYAYYNEQSVPFYSVGTTSVIGKFDPGENRTSYLLRLMFEKSGSPTPADLAQKGSYWFTARPCVYGDGIVGPTGNSGSSGNAQITMQDNGMVSSGAIDFRRAAVASNIVDGALVGVGDVVFDRTTQRLWCASSDGTKGALAYWRYKSPEGIRIVASSTGAGNDLIPTLNVTGALPRGMDIGTDGTVYVPLYGGARAGWLRVNPDLTFTHVLATNVALGANTNGLRVDRTRARKRNGIATLAPGANVSRIQVTGESFTNADIERVVKVTGGAADGLYRISEVNAADTVTVVKMDGSAQTFPADTVGQSIEIGDRIYLFWNDATSSPGKVTFMDSLAWGVVLSRTVTMTNGATAYNGAVNGMPAPTAIDPATSALYWVSSDTAVQVNRYDPATNTWARRVLTGDLNVAPAGGSGTLTAPTALYTIAVNPHASFREVWVGTNQGHIRLNADNFAGAFDRYFGSGEDATPANIYTVGGRARPDGGGGTQTNYGGPNVRDVRQYAFGIDGRVVCHVGGVPGGFAQFNREADGWFYSEGTAKGLQPTWTGWSETPAYHRPFTITPYGELAYFWPDSTRGAVNGGASWVLGVHNVDIHYQWIGGAWVPKEVVRGPLPGALSPGCAAKDLHTTEEALLYGVKVKFAMQSADTPANNNYLGRMAQVGATRTDGATFATGSADQSNFAGSGFVAADAGRYLHIHDGAQAAVYVISAYIDANKVTIRKLNPGVAFTSTTAAGGLTYSVWEPPANGGSECLTVHLADGILRDNVSTVTGISYEIYDMRTLLSEQEEGVKPMLPGVAPRAGQPVKLYFDRVNTWNPALQAHLPLGTEITAGSTNGVGALLPMLGVDCTCDGTAGRPSLMAAISGTANWGGSRSASTSCTGYVFGADFGADVEVGSVIIRGHNGNSSTPYFLLTNPTANGGCIGNLYSSAGDAAPAASADSRIVGGTGLTYTNGSATISLAGGANFLGPLVETPTDGTIVSGGSTITSAVGRFTGREGMVVVLASSADAGAYRILSVNGDGSAAVVRNLNQTPKTWITSQSPITFEIRDAVREEDLVASPSKAVQSQKFVIERLTSATTAEVRIYPGTSASNQTWECVKPSWRHVKRLSHSVLATAPDVANNGTYTSPDGREWSTGWGDYKFVFDLSDLAPAKRTARYWKFAAMNRMTGGVNANMPLISFEFFAPDGKRLGIASSHRIDAAERPDFYACLISRVDIIQASDTSAMHNGGGGLANLSDDTVSLVGGKKWLGYEVRTGAGGFRLDTDAANTFTKGASDPNFVDSDVGRTLHVESGPNAGFYRISAVPSASQVYVTSPAGSVVNLSTDAGPTPYRLHEGIAGGTGGDFLAFTTGGNNPAVREYPVLGVSDDLLTLTLSDKLGIVLTNQNWEIRRRASWSPSTTTDATKTARLLALANAAAPRQPGDFSQDTKGSIHFYPNDVGGFVTRAGGASGAGTGTFTGTFTPDDVGRVLRIESGADRGHYQISAHGGATVTVVNLWTGAAVSFTGSAGVNYTILGDRRFRISRYATVLRD